MSDPAPQTSSNSSEPGQSAQVLAALVRIAAERLELQPDQMRRIEPEVPIVEGLQLDSLAQVTLLTAIEDEFGFEIEPEDRERIRTVGDLVETIRERSTRGASWR